MPYIKKEYRPRLNKILKGIHHYLLEKGDLEYCITVLLHAYMSSRVVNYSNLHDAVYAAVHAGHEFERMHLDKREDEAIKANGDVEYVHTV